MTSPTTSPIAWATDATITSGADAGRTTRLPPPGGQAAQGFIADNKIAARVLNHVVGANGDWVAYLAAQKMLSWSPAFVESSDANGLFFGRMFGVGGRLIVPLSMSSETTGWAEHFPSPYGQARGLHDVVISLSDDFSYYGAVAAAFDGASVVYAPALAGPASGTKAVKTTGLAGTTASEITVAAANEAAIAVISPATGEFILSSVAAGVGCLYRSTNSGANWSAVLTTIPGPIYHLAQDPTGATLLAGVQLDVDGDLVGFISTNYGEDWDSTVISTETETELVGLCRVAGAFLALAKSGNIYRLADGGTWSLLHSDSGVAAIDASAIMQGIASDGGQLICYWTADPMYGDADRIGLSVSSDGGSNWTFVPVCVENSSPTRMQVVYDGLGKFYASYVQSGLLQMVVSG